MPTTSKGYNSLNYSTTLSRRFLKENLSSLALTSTYTLGKNVYNIRDKASNKVVGFLGYLVSYSKLPSLVNYIYKKGRVVVSFLKVLILIVTFRLRARL